MGTLSFTKDPDNIKKDSADIKATISTTKSITNYAGKTFNESNNSWNVGGLAGSGAYLWKYDDTIKKYIYYTLYVYSASRTNTRSKYGSAFIYAWSSQENADTVYTTTGTSYTFKYSQLTSGAAITKNIRAEVWIPVQGQRRIDGGYAYFYTHYTSDTELTDPTISKVTQSCTRYYHVDDGWEYSTTSPGSWTDYGDASTATVDFATGTVTFYTRGDEFHFGAEKDTVKIKDVLTASNVASWGKACAAKRSWLKQANHYDWCDSCKTVSGRVTADWYNKCRNCVEGIASDTRPTTSYATADETRITAERINKLDISYS